MTGKDKTTLGGTFGGKTKGSQISYGHPFGAELMESASIVMRQTTIGTKLLKLLEYKKVPVSIIKGTGQSGFTPELMTIYLQVPGNMTVANSPFIINLVKALHEAAQEMAGFKTPDPSKDIMAYANFVHTRNLDSITEVCRFVKELTNSSNFSDFLDSLTEMGLSGVYKAFIDGQPREVLFERYVSAYDTAVRGS